MTSTRSKVGKPTMLVDKVLRNNVLWDPDLERITRIRLHWDLGLRIFSIVIHGFEPSFAVKKYHVVQLSLLGSNVKIRNKLADSTNQSLRRIHFLYSR